MASVVRHMRLGAGGVMLPNHAPLVVAEEFRTLEALFPGRIDLGVGRARAIEDELLPALRRSLDSHEAFSEQLCELRGFLAGAFDMGHPFQQLALPDLAAHPPVYMLGASVCSAKEAALQGLPFAYAHFQNADGAIEALTAYRKCFVGPDRPYAIVSVRACGRATSAEAAVSASWETVVNIRRHASRRASLAVDAEVLLSETLTAREQELAAAHLADSSVLVGDAQSLKSKLSALAALLGADEMMVLPIDIDESGRAATMRTLAAGQGRAAGVGADADASPRWSRSVTPS